MTSLERDQQLPTTSEVSFEINITPACFWLIVLYLYCWFLYAIDRYCIGMLHDTSCLVPKIPFARARGYKIDAFVRCLGAWSVSLFRLQL